MPAPTFGYEAPQRVQADSACFRSRLDRNNLGQTAHGVSIESPFGRPVDDCNDDSRAKHLNEVGDGLKQREREPNIQAYVVV